MDDNFWKCGGPTSNRIMTGVLGEEISSRPGTYRFQSDDGLAVADAHILSADSDTGGYGDIVKPKPGTPCVALMSSTGGQCLITGFLRPPAFSEKEDDVPVVGNPDDNQAAGDKVYKTSGGATLNLRRGGTVIIEGGPGTAIIMNPVNNTQTIRCANLRQAADGYKVKRGRVSVGETSPSTISEEDYLNQVGSSHDRVRIRHGSLGDDARRELRLSAVTVAGGVSTGVIKTRERYYSDGSWVGEGPNYQWGGSGADENAVLGNQLVEALNDLIDTLKNLKVNTAFGPSTPPLPDTIAKLESLSAELDSGKILSTYLFFSKNPVTLGTE